VTGEGFIAEIKARFTVGVGFEPASGEVSVDCEPAVLPELCEWLFQTKGCRFDGLVVEDCAERLQLVYLFSGGDGETRCVQVRTSAPAAVPCLPSISAVVHAADWHEREAEDLFGLVFEGHPRLGDFILHDDRWQEGVEPMRHGFEPMSALEMRKPDEQWRPRRIVEAPGAFIMPIGPVFAGEAESAHFQLETIGEEIIRAYPRLFFKYRGVEKRAEGRPFDEVLLLAERFSGTTAFSHALAYCMAVEGIAGVDVPARARFLRIFFAELERLRSHVGTIEAVCRSTGLVVAASQAAILEEEILRLSGALAGHRYLFGLAIPGGLSLDCDDKALRATVQRAKALIRKLEELERLLTTTSSFLDRIEEVGVVTKTQARQYGLVGPPARAAGIRCDIRRGMPYSGYDRVEFEIPREEEGDGYARLRVLFAEAAQAVRIMDQAARSLPQGAISVRCEPAPGVAVQAVEAPRGAAWHWVRLDGIGSVRRYRIITPSFANWHGFHLAAEGFAFQDFPIILATFGLSVAENDR